MTFGGLDDDDDDTTSEFSVFLDDTPLLRAAAAGSKGLNDRPKLRETLTGVSYMRDSSAKAGLDIVTTVDPHDEAANKQYHEKLTEIRTSSAVYQSRQAVRQRAKSLGRKVENEKDMRAAVCAELHSLPSVPHPPSVRASMDGKVRPNQMPNMLSLIHDSVQFELQHCRICRRLTYGDSSIVFRSCSGF